MARRTRENKYKTEKLKSMLGKEVMVVDHEDAIAIRCRQTLSN